MKKIKLPEKKTGIWIDQEQALLVRIVDDKEPIVEKINSDVESRVRIKGEENVSARFGNSFIDDQEKKQRRQRHERKRYFDEIIEKIRDDNYIFLFGPGKGKEELNNAIEKAQEHGMKAKVILKETADRLTENQLLEKVNGYFGGSEFRKEKKKLRQPEKEAAL